MEQPVSVVEQELWMYLVLSPERSVPVPARLSYRSDDPFAVFVIFHLDTGTPVTWVFARELLVEGTFRPCGRGDVRIWPRLRGGRGVLSLSLTSPAGDALLEAPLATVATWLDRTHRLVPPGAELSVLDLEGSLEDLLA